jgi:starch-binding outer membrane protein, SusD/RagB family
MTKNFMNMKRFKYYLSIFILTSILAPLFQGCEDALDSKTFTSLGPDNFFRTESDLQVATGALYNPLATDWARAYNGDPRNYLGMQSITTDEATDNWGTPFGTRLMNFQVGPAGYDGSWVQNYEWYFVRFIARATDVIDMIEKSPVSDNLKNRYIAEVKTVRAMLSWIVYDLYGPINAIYDPRQLSNLEPSPRPDKTTYLNQMIKDLTEAIPHLLEKTNGTSQWGRFNKNAARAILMRIYLNDKQWAKAVEYGKAIEANGGYALLPKYYEVFNIQQNNEIIYAAAASPQMPNYFPTEATMWDLQSANDGLVKKPTIGGWGPGWIMPWEFYDKYPDGDLRKLTIMAEYTDIYGVVRTRNNNNNLAKGAIPLKFTDFSRPSGNGYVLDQPVFRLAEVYLSISEALNELNGPTEEAIKYAKYVTDRAGITIPEAAKATKESFRDFILDERGRELYLEYIRRTDLIRHGKFISKAQARGKNAQPHQVLFPIPYSVILQSNGIVEQNPGYVQ